MARKLKPTTTKERVVDAPASRRSHAADGDQLLSLFHFGFVIDEQLDDRLAELKRSTPDPIEALPELGATSKSWDASGFLKALGGLATPTFAGSSVGQRLNGAPRSTKGVSASWRRPARPPAKTSRRASSSSTAMGTRS